MNPGHTIARFWNQHGMVLVLALLALYFSAATWTEQHPVGADAGRQVLQQALKEDLGAGPLLVIAQKGNDGQAFIEAVKSGAGSAGIPEPAVSLGEPWDAREALDRAAAGEVPKAMLLTQEVASWEMMQNLAQTHPALSDVRILVPQITHWPDFLKRSNLLAITNRIVVIAIIAIGMTMVIITGGIDLSVGSLIAFSAVLSTLLIRQLAGAEQATALGMVLCCGAGILASSLVGAFSGLMVTRFSIPPFIVTLAMMMVSSGLAFILSKGQSIYELPSSLTWLGRGVGPFGIPNAVSLMILLYVAAHVLMTRTVLGRHIYAVGGNIEAARLSGIPVKRVLLFVYTLCGGLAGVGGVIAASQLKSGAPIYGGLHELYVIAAVVVGGTSLSGGKGKISGTLIGAFVIAVIQNGMNLTGVESYTQNVVLGLVILGAVTLDMMKNKG